MKNALRVFVPVLFSVLAFGASAPLAFAADSWAVNSSNPDDSLCVATTFQCKTIQAAVTVAASGDTINVAGGTYDLTSRIDVNKSVSIVGDVTTPADVVINAPVAGGTQHGQNSVFMITSSDVTIEGFRIQGALHTGAVQNAGIYVDDPNVLSHPGLSNITISNNEITDNGYGIVVQNIRNSTISNNKIYDNKKVVGKESESGVGIIVYGDATGDNATYKLIIDHNDVYNNETEGIRVGVGAGTGPVYLATNLETTISDNHIYNNGSTISGIDTYIGIKSSGWSYGVTVSGNEIYNHTGTTISATSGNAGIQIHASKGWSIINNNIHNNINGIIFANSGAGGATTGSHTITGNTIANNIRGISLDKGTEAVANNNSIYSNSSTVFSGTPFLPYGVYNSSMVAFDATQNWWGDATGPLNAATNPLGLGNSVSDNVTFTPWYSTSEMSTLVYANISAYNIALAAVIEADYTAASWATYQGVVSANVVTDQNTQVQVDTATSNITTAQGSLVLKQAQTITVNTPAPGSTVYNSSFGVMASSTSLLPVAITTTGSCSGSGTDSATITMTSGTGTCTVHYNQAGNGNYNAAQEVTNDTAASKVLITVTAQSNTKIYDGTTTIATTTPLITSGALQGSDSVTWTETYDTTGVGTGKTLTPAGTISDGNGGNNYGVSFVNDTTGVIAQSPLGITPDNRSKTFGDTVTFAGTEFTLGELFGEGDKLDSASLASDGAIGTAGVGSYDITGSSPVGTGLTNYDYHFNVGTLTVNADPAASSFVLATSTGPGGTSGTIPGDTPPLDVTTPAGNVSVDMPANLTVTGPSGWDGTIDLPTVTDTTVAPVADSGTTATVTGSIEIGFGNDTLTFNKGVRIFLTGQAGNLIGYSHGAGTFTEITNVCADDSQATGDALAAGSDCKIDVGGDLVVWTKHFSTFTTYTQTPVVTSPGHSGGGNACGLGFTFNPSTLGCDRATPAVPANVTTPVGCAPGDKFSTTTGRSCNAATPATGQGQVLGAATFNFTRNLGVGLSGEDVTALQQILIDAGLLKINAPTGNFGQLTKAAVQAFQKSHGVSQTGFVGPLTRGELNKGVTPTNLTSVQADAILSLLESFGADASVVAKVRASLGR